MKYRYKIPFGFILAFFSILLICDAAHAQQPYPPYATNPDHYVGVYLLSITPKNGGKSYTLFHKTKVIMTMPGNKEVKGKVRGVSRDSISIEYKSYAIDDIQNLKFSQGSTLGLVAAGAMLVGVVAIAVVGTKDTRTSTEDAIFWSGVGLAAAGAITLIPTHFLKKSFDRSEYEFTAVMVGSY